MNNSKTLNTIKKGTIEIISEEELINKLESKEPLRIKFGADPTAPDIHLGHTVVLYKLRQLQDLGHKVIFIIGDFTAQIGDPSGRLETRPPLTKEQITKNAETYKQQIFKILLSDSDKLELVYNSSWLNKMDIKEIIQLSSRYTVARMLERDDFQKRYQTGNPISILEFLYPLIQGYDSIQVKADIEIGGSDQKFNLLVGRDLMRDFGLSPQVVVTLPLLEGTDGIRKMSKSYNNYIGINESPKEIFGKIMSISDELMYRYYELLTNEELAKVKKQHPMEAKKKLGEILVARFYDKFAATQARSEFKKVFRERQLPTEIEEFAFDRSPISIIDGLTGSGMVSSKREAKRLIEQGAIKLDGEKISDPRTPIDLNTEHIIQSGTRNFRRISKIRDVH